MSDIKYRRNLPHIHPEGYPLFITLRLADSLPTEVLAELNASANESLPQTHHHLNFTSLRKGSLAIMMAGLIVASMVRAGWKMKMLPGLFPIKFTPWIKSVMIFMPPASCQTMDIYSLNHAQ